MFSLERIVLYAIFILLYLSTRHESVLGSKYFINNEGMQILQYKLHFEPNIEQKTFTSQCKWIVQNEKRVEGYSFYERNINITTSNLIKLDSDDNTSYELHENVDHYRSTRNPEPTHINTNLLTGDYPEGNYSVEFKNISGSLENYLQGFYLDEYPDEDGNKMDFLTTQFAPFGTSYAFPSMDEPRFRAKFEITIARPKDYTSVIANANLETSTPKDNLIEDKFEITEKISPSSVAFTISKMEISEEIDGSIHRIVARPAILKLGRHEYVANIIDRVYQKVEDFLQVSCELQNLYHIALPSNRMKFESLGSYRGIIHYKERVLIFSNESTIETQKSSTLAIAKLIAQQWFLSYLMVDSWTWAWINEGLTMYLSYYITEKFYPNWAVQEGLIMKTRMAMQDDSSCCCKSINSESRKSSEIESKFNRVTVFKGTALITMMEKIIPPEVFRDGLTNLIKEKKWGTYTSEDVYKEFDDILMQNSSDDFNLSSISSIMSAWESQVGFPVVEVTRNYTNDFDYVGLSQMRFRFGYSQNNDVWPIPINYATKLDPDFSKTKPTLWLNSPNETIRIKSLNKTDWLILNNQATYYYRVNYDDTNWRAIAKALLENHQDIHYLNRMQIIDDAFTLAEFGMLEYSIPFKISQYIRNEREYAPLKAMKEAYDSINNKIAGSDLYGEFQKFIKKSVEYIYEHIVIRRSADNAEQDNNSKKFYTMQVLLHFLFSWLCDLQSTICENNYRLSKGLSFKFSSDFEWHVLCRVMHRASAKNWYNLFATYRKSFSNRKAETNIFNALGCSADSALQKRFLNYVFMSEKDKLNNALKLTIRHGSNGTNTALKFISLHFGDLLKASVSKDIEDLLFDIGSRITTEKELESLLQLSKEHEKYDDLIKPALSRAKQNMIWRKRHLRKFKDYFHDKKSIGSHHHANTLIVLCFTNLILH